MRGSRAPDTSAHGAFRSDAHLGLDPAGAGRHHYAIAVGEKIASSIRVGVGTSTVQKPVRCQMSSSCISPAEALACHPRVGSAPNGSSIQALSVGRRWLSSRARIATSLFHAARELMRIGLAAKRAALTAR